MPSRHEEELLHRTVHKSVRRILVNARLVASLENMSLHINGGLGVPWVNFGLRPIIKVEDPSRVFDQSRAQFGAFLPNVWGHRD